MGPASVVRPQTTPEPVAELSASDACSCIINAPIVHQETFHQVQVNDTITSILLTIACSPGQRGVVFACAQDFQHVYDCRATIEFAGGGDIRVCTMSVRRVCQELGEERVVPTTFTPFFDVMKVSTGRRVVLHEAYADRDVSHDSDFLTIDMFQHSVGNVRAIQRAFRAQKTRLAKARARRARTRRRSFPPWGPPPTPFSRFLASS